MSVNDKTENRGTHGVSSSMLDTLVSSSENPLSLDMGSVKATVIVNIQLTAILNMDGNPTEKDFQAVRDIAGFYAKTLKEAGADDAIATDTKIFTHEGDSNDSARNA